jgi:hypothetical protein
MKRIDVNLRGAIPMNQFLSYFQTKIKKFAQKIWLNTKNF